MRRVLDGSFRVTGMLGWRAAAAGRGVLRVQSQHKKANAAMAPRAAAAAAATAASPIGVALSNTHEIGRSIGQGEFGEVYAVKGGKTKSWVVKVTAVPTKITKKQNSPAESAACRLYSEYLVYSNCRNLSGSILPLLPSNKTDKIEMYYNNLNGFRCLVMEQLQCLLFETLRPLVTSSAGQFIELGQTAGQLMTIVEKMHESGYLIVDIKPDNFMVASTLGTGVVTDASLAASVRLIDLGLAMAFKGLANERTGGLAGNALYASLNVHESETPSRRDDVQSILFLIANMVLTVQAIDLGKAPPYGKGDRASHLPWSQENSDEAVGAAKRALVLDEDSDFYQQMPSEAAKILFDCIVESSSHSYKQTPSYEDLRQGLSTLKVPRTFNQKPAPRGSKTAEAVKPAPTRQLPRKTTRSSASSRDASDDVDDPQDVQPKRSSKAARTRPLYVDDDDVVMEEETASNEEEEENETSIMADVDLSVTGFGLFCKDKDLWIVLSNDSPKVVVGKRPSCKEGSLIVLNDPSLEPSHVMLKLGSIPGAVVVKPHNEKAIVLLENGRVPLSGTCALKGQTIEFGDFSFKVRILPIQSSSVKKVATKHHGLTKSPQKLRAQPRSHHHELAKSPQKPRAQPRLRRALLEIVAGSLKGNKYELIPDNRDVIIVGSDPSGDGFLVTLDEVGVTENHVRFELSHNKFSGTTVTMHVLMAPFDLEVNGETMIDADIICIADDSVIKLAEDACVAVTFTMDD